jgi:hypothetical protein
MLVHYPDPLVRRTLVDVAWRDKEDSVKASAARTLARISTVEEVSALMDLLHLVPEESEARKPLFDALRKATGMPFANLASLWEEWWDDKGREAVGEKIEELNKQKIKESEARFRQMQGGQREEEEQKPETGE